MIRPDVPDDTTCNGVWDTFLPLPLYCIYVRAEIRATHLAGAREWSKKRRSRSPTDEDADHAFLQHKLHVNP
jgi:hypothetical protein